MQSDADNSSTNAVRLVIGLHSFAGDARVTKFSDCGKYDVTIEIKKTDKIGDNNETLFL